MMNHEDRMQESPTVLQEVVKGPGAKLRAAREAARISQAEIADNMRLNTKVIAAIDNDNYSQMPALTFVRGYLRTYAAIVNLDPNEIIDNFNQLNLEESRPLVHPTQLHNRETALSRYSKRSLIYAALLLMISACLLWFYYRLLPNNGGSISMPFVPQITKTEVPLSLPSISPSKSNENMPTQTASPNTVVNSSSPPVAEEKAAVEESDSEE